MPDSHIDLSDTGVWAIQMQQQQGQVDDEDDDDFQILNKSKAFNPLFIALISRFHSSFNDSHIHLSDTIVWPIQI